MLRFALTAGALVGVGLLSIALIPTEGGGGSPFSVFTVGYLIGAVFGHAAAAAAWAALGPGPVYVRIPLSILWCGLAWVAMMANVLINGLPANEVVFVMLGCIAGIWILVQTPYWLLRWLGGMSLRLPGTEVKSAAPPQYGIRQLLIFTTIVALIFGAGRLAVSLIPSLGGVPRNGESIGFMFLAVAAMLLALPLAPAILLPRWSLLATTLILVLAALATWWELPLFMQLMGRGGGGPQFMHFVWFNLFTACWVAALTSVVRLQGYRFAGATNSAVV